MKIFALVLFILMYVLMITKPKYRPYYALGTGLIYLVAGVLPLSNLPSVINWNVLLMISGTMILVDFFIASKMPNLMADILLDKCPNVMWVTISMSLFAGAISAFIDNVATVLMVAPVGLAVCKKLNINPVGMIISIAVSSNLQGAATLVGDTTSIMLGDYAHMNFMNFFWMDGKPGMFFAVELGALAPGAGVLEGKNGRHRLCPLFYAPSDGCRPDHGFLHSQYAGYHKRCDLLHPGNRHGHHRLREIPQDGERPPHFAKY